MSDELASPVATSAPARGLRGALARLRDDPNPIWEREMQQSVRRGAIPVVQMLLTIALALLLCAIGGTMSVLSHSAAVGHALFQTFFSIAYFVVTLAGPALAATSIVSEREGRTWEAVVLTGMRPSRIAHGKFLAALTTIGSYLVMLAPVGALPFLFGGVTATETFLAFALLGALAAVGVAFGLAISSKMMRTGAAVVVTLLLSFVLSTIGFSTLGVGLSFAAQALWPAVSGGSPVWLPLAYDRADLGVAYVLFLVVVPIAATAMPAWFLYEATIANLSNASDDRSTGLKRWFVTTLPVFTAIVCALPAGLPAPDRPYALMLGLAALACLLGFVVFVFAGEPLGPSRRVEQHWADVGASARTRLLGPGLVRTMQLVLVLGLFAIAAACAAGFALSMAASRGTVGASRTTLALEVGVLAAYAAAFFTFLVGVAAYARARSTGAAAARGVLLLVVIVASAGPWLVALIGGVIARAGVDDALLVAAPSPFYALRMAHELERHGPATGATMVGGVAAMAMWTLAGLALLAMAGRRAARVIGEHRAALARVDAALEAEDAATAP